MWLVTCLRMRGESLVAHTDLDKKKMATEMIPGLFDAEGHEDPNHGMSLSGSLPLSSTRGGETNRSILEELLAEKGSLGPNFAHSIRLLDEGKESYLCVFCNL